MRLLLFSDNHRDKESVKQMIKKNNNIDHIISLGDSEMKEHELTSQNIYGVKGNYPFEPNFPKDLTFEYFGIKVYYTHGHHYSVKLGLSRLLNYAYYNNINIVCYGHTHVAALKEINDILFINPGSLSKNRMSDYNSYAILEITEEIINVDIVTLSGENLFNYTKQR